MDLKKPIPKKELPGEKIGAFSPTQEPMFYLNDSFLCYSAYNHWREDRGRPLPGSSKHLMARRTVIEKLKEAELLLPLGYKFLIYDAYRPVIIQQELWDFYKRENIKEIKKKKRGLSAVAISDLAEKETLKFVARPSYNIILASPHNTGGAVDLTIVDEDGIPLDMGCEFDDFSDKTWSDFYEYFDNSEDETAIKIRNNRRMLYNVMTAVGFTNLPSEIWHYDYGNENWAYYNNCAPLYTGILDASVRDGIYYSKADLVKSFDKRQQMHLGSIISAKDECERLAIQLKYSISDDEF